MPRGGPRDHSGLNLCIPEITFATYRGCQAGNWSNPGIEGEPSASNRMDDLDAALAPEGDVLAVTTRGRPPRIAGPAGESDDSRAISVRNIDLTASSARV
jgi:hypothetical protein